MITWKQIVSSAQLEVQKYWTKTQKGIVATYIHKSSFQDITNVQFGFLFGLVRWNCIHSVPGQMSLHVLQQDTQQKTLEEEAVGCRVKGVNGGNHDTFLMLAKDSIAAKISSKNGRKGNL